MAASTFVSFRCPVKLLSALESLCVTAGKRDGLSARYPRSHMIVNALLQFLKEAGVTYEPEKDNEAKPLYDLVRDRKRSRRVLSPRVGKPKRKASPHRPAKAKPN